MKSEKKSKKIRAIELEKEFLMRGNWIEDLKVIELENSLLVVVRNREKISGTVTGALERLGGKVGYISTEKGVIEISFWFSCNEEASASSEEE